MILAAGSRPLPRARPAGPNTRPQGLRVSIPFRSTFRRKLAFRELRRRALQSRVQSRRDLLTLKYNPQLRVCVSRSVRKQVMFALRVAGRRWNRGGPDMRNNRRSVSSAFSCRR